MAITELKQIDVEQTLPSPEVPCCAPNEVVITLSTTVAIPDYTRYYNSPILEFAPAYMAYNDGSLLLQPFVDAHHESLVSILTTGILITLFVRNTLVCIVNLRRTTVQKKALFYALLISQILGIIALAFAIYEQLDFLTRCRITMIITCALGAVSLNILMTGVLGYKAYRCLNDSRAVLATLILLATSSIIFTILNLVTLQTERGLAGGCRMKEESMQWIRVYLIIQLAEALFISLCFLSAVWKSRDSPIARGRMSIRLSMQEVEDENCELSSSRGWWDYVPNKETNDSNLPARKPHLLRSIRIIFQRSLRLRRLDFQNVAESKPRLSDVLESREHRRSIASYHSTFRWLLPRVETLHKAMQDELIYTSLISSICVVNALLSVIGSSTPNGVSILQWIGLNWIVVSLLSIHSFSRVVRRQEREQAQSHYCRNAGHPDFITGVGETRTAQHLRNALENPFDDRHASPPSHSLPPTSSSSLGSIEI